MASSAELPKIPGIGADDDEKTTEEVPSDPPVEDENDEDIHDDDDETPDEENQAALATGLSKALGLESELVTTATASAKAAGAGRGSVLRKGSKNEHKAADVPHSPFLNVPQQKTEAEMKDFWANMSQTFGG